MSRSRSLSTVVLRIAQVIALGSEKGAVLRVKGGTIRFCCESHKERRGSIT